MKKMNKKGFTIVELVIVIAVIAILAAVLIPTYSSLVKKANRSADMQAVREMNTALAMSEIDGKDIVTAYAALKDAGMTAKDYTPLTSGTQFYWDQKLNRVIYVEVENGKSTVIYPEVETKEENWFILNGQSDVKTITPKTESGTTVYEIGTAQELYSLAQQVSSATAQGSFKIKFTAKEINLQGLDVAFTLIGNGSSSTTFTIEGAEDGTTIKNLVSLESHYELKEKKYFTGLIAEVQNATVSISNITIDNMTAGNLEVGTVGTLIGYTANAKVTLDKVKVQNSTVYGKNKVGGMIGAIAGYSEVEIKNSCTLENVTVNCSEGESGRLIGALYAGSPSSKNTNTKSYVKLTENATLNNVNLNLVNGSHTRKQQQTAGFTVVEELKKTGKSENRWRVFDKDAKYCVGVLQTGATVTIGTSTTYSYGNTDNTAVDGWEVGSFKIIK